MHTYSHRSFIKWRLGITFYSILSLFLGSCATPIRSEEQSLLLQRLPQEAREITLDVLVLTDVTIEKREDLYIEGFLRDRDPGNWKRGWKVSIWFEPLGENSTKIYIDTAKRGSLGLGSPNIAVQLLNIIKKVSERSP